MRRKARHKLEALLAPADVKVGGDRPWDIQVHNDEFCARVLSEGSMGLGESYMDGWWDCAKLDAFFYRILRTGLDDKIKPWIEVFWALKGRLVNLQRLSRAYQIGQHHYDMGNTLFKHMLDRRLIYSCGYWENATTLDEAQEAKLDLVCRKLRLQPGMRVLDIGCGWGGTARFIAEKYQAEVVGITVSEEQTRFGKELCRDYAVDIRLQDYRSLRDKFDRILSIGMFEHVGHKNYVSFVHKVKTCLKDDGLFLLHTIGGNRSVFHIDPWIQRYIFPNSMLPSARQICSAIEGLFVFENWHNFGADYDKTLMQWFRNFDTNWGFLKEQYDDRFYRMWKYYLLSCAGASRTDNSALADCPFPRWRPRWLSNLGGIMTVMNSEVVELCRRMVAEASVNPQDTDRVDFPYGESRMAVLVADWLNKAGLEVQIQQVRTGRKNVLATATGKDTSKTLLLSAHMDTVDVKDMTIEPFDPQIRQGRIYGRGTCDDKGPLAAMMIAFRDRVRAGNLPCNLVLLASCGEEYDMTGSRYFAEHWADMPAGDSRLYAAVMAEPTELKAVVAHKGVVRLRILSRGKSAHSSMPALGKNAIYQMARALTAVEEFAGELAERPGHPRLKTETLSATIVNGGQQINVIPDRCEARIDWRILPGRSPKQCRDELEAVLTAKLCIHENDPPLTWGANKCVGQSPTLHKSDEPIKVEIINAYNPMETQADHSIVKSLLSAAKKTIGESEAIVVGYATDASAFSQLNIPTPIIGPGCPLQAHTQDEFIEIKQLEKGLATYKLFLEKEWGEKE